MDIKGRQVDRTSIEVDGNVFDEMFFIAADWADNGQPLNEDELYMLNQNYDDVLYEMVYDQMVANAEAAYEGDR